MSAEITFVSDEGSYAPRAASRTGLTVAGMEEGTPVSGPRGLARKRALVRPWDSSES